MSKKMTYQYDHATGISEVREATPEELELIAQGAKDKADREKAMAESRNVKRSARQKLLALGLTEKEVTALIGETAKG